MRFSHFTLFEESYSEYLNVMQYCLLHAMYDEVTTSYWIGHIPHDYDGKCTLLSESYGLQLVKDN